jgi:ferric iron reductase protein FhuF
MRKATVAIVVLALAGGLYLLRLHYPTASLMNESEWTLFGKGSEWFWALMQFVIVTITLVLIYGELRISSAAHILVSLTALNERWTSKDLVSQRKKICAAHLKGDRVLTLGNQIVFTFFEELGLYVKQGWIPRQVIWDTYSYYIENYWDMCSQEVVDRGRESNDSSIFEHFGKLAAAMRILNKRRKIPCTRRTKEQLREFARGEMAADLNEAIDDHRSAER